VTCRASAKFGAGALSPSLAEVREGWRRLTLREPRLAALPAVDAILLSRSEGAAGLDAPVTLVPIPADEGLSPALSLAAQRPSGQHSLDAAPARRLPSATGWLAMGVAATLAGLAVLQLVQADRVVRVLSERQEAARMGSLKPLAAPSIPWRR